MMIATCISVPPGRLDDRFDMLQVLEQRLSADLSDAVAGLGTPRFEGLRAGDVTRFLELAGMGAQVAVADIEQRFQFVEGEFFVGRESAHDAEAHALVDQAVESAVLVRSVRSRDGFGLQFGLYCVLFHRILAFGRVLAFCSLGPNRHDSLVRSGCRKWCAGPRSPAPESACGIPWAPRMPSRRAA